jgi:O-glycosyl hydrolase
MSFYPVAVISLFTVAAAGTAISQELSHVDIAAASGSQIVALEDGSLTLRATRPMLAGSNYFGIEGGTNDFAIDDEDGAEPADEVLEMELGGGHGLTGIDFIWTRGVLSLSGFSGDPMADRGSYDGTGTWTLSQPWTGSTSTSVRFANPGASAGLVLQFSILDPLKSKPQAALQRLYIRSLDSPVGVITVDPTTTHQTLDHFGASMFWTIDPTAGWPESIREQLALMLVSEAGGLGLSNLRFDFGGGSNGPGTIAAEPWSWRFPEALKDGPNTPFDWSRRAGQQWFLKRADQLGIGTLTLGAVSPPWWMTRNGLTRCDPTVGSTNLDPAKVDDFASYLADVLGHFRDQEGITFDEVSPFNEPEWSWNSSSQEGCRFTAADARPLVLALHHELIDRSLHGDTAILLGEHGIISSMLDDALQDSYAGSVWNGGHNSSSDGKYREYLKDLHSHPDLSGKTSGAAAYHSYWTDDLTGLNGPVRDLLRQNAHEDGLELVQTEYAILGAEGPGRNLQFGPAMRVARVIHRDLTRADAIGWSWWLALSPHDYKDGLIYTDAQSANVSQPRLFRSRIAAALGHYSRFIRPGWQRLDTPGTDDLAGIFASAWRSPDHREIAIVVSNARHFPQVVQLPDNSLGDFGAVQEWEVWITDRGRYLERAVIVGRNFELPAHSFTTFVGRPRQSMFRLGASIHTTALQATAGQEIVVAATSHWENGVVVCPALSATEEWVLVPIDAAPVGHPQAGRHCLRRHANGDYLHFIEGGQQILPTAGPSAVWDLDTPGPDSLALTHHETGLGMGPDGRLTPRAAAPLPYQLTLLTPSFQWADGLGSTNTATLTTQVPRTVSVRAFHPDASASARLRLPAGEAVPSLTLTPSATTIRRGEPITLRAEVHGGEAWTFRLVPSDRDEVIRAAAGGTLSMSEPAGNDGERWQLVEPDGSRVWALPHTGRTCRIRSSTHGGVLQPEGTPAAAVPLTAGESGGTESLWTIQRDEGSGFRIEHSDSGLVLNISSSTGLPILGADEGRRSERFHFDSVASPPARLQWSHGLGSGSEIIVSPLHSTSYVVDAEMDGLRLQSRVAVTVTRTFDEWMSDWFGATRPENEDGDGDGDGVPLVLEYARGSDPLRSDAAGWQEFDLQSRSISWKRNPEALGTWTVETSTNLQTWEPTTLPVDPSPDRLTVTLPEILPDRSFFRLKFNPESF